MKTWTESGEAESRNSVYVELRHAYDVLGRSRVRGRGLGVPTVRRDVFDVVMPCPVAYRWHAESTWLGRKMVVLVPRNSATPQSYTVA